MKRRPVVHDMPLLILGILASAVGLLFAFDAGYARSLRLEGRSIPQEFVTQVIVLGLSLFGFAIVARIPRDFWRKAAYPLWAVSLASLIAVELVGTVQNGAKRWLFSGMYRVQPAEFAKVALVLYLACAFANHRPWPKRIPKLSRWHSYVENVAVPWLRRLLPFAMLGVAALLIEQEPDLGTAAVLVATGLAMMYVGGVSTRIFGAIAVLTCFVLYGLVHNQPYRVERFAMHAERWTPGHADEVGFQTVQSEASMASGGLLGVGFGNGRAKHVIPAPTTDFVMATVGEETGLVGSLIVIGIVGALVCRLLWLATRTRDRFSSLVLFGTAAWIGVQASVNVMMANGFLPAIGIPLPFISSGGSSLFSLWIALGLCQSALAPVADPVSEAPKEVRRARNRHRWRNGRSRLSGA